MLSDKMSEWSFRPTMANNFLGVFGFPIFFLLLSPSTSTAMAQTYVNTILSVWYLRVTWETVMLHLSLTVTLSTSHPNSGDYVHYLPGFITLHRGRAYLGCRDRPFHYNRGLIRLTQEASCAYFPPHEVHSISSSYLLEGHQLPYLDILISNRLIVFSIILSNGTETRDIPRY